MHKGRKPAGQRRERGRRQAAEGARAREVGDGVAAAGEVTPCRALPGVEAAVALQGAGVARGVSAARSVASVRLVPCAHKGRARGLGWAVLGRLRAQPGLAAFRPSGRRGGAPVCVRRCRSKLLDRGEVYWQPGKVQTCTTGITKPATPPRCPPSQPQPLADLLVRPKEQQAGS